ncbi:Glutathione-regulated potassium-efflux system ancillary protein KefG [Sinobacterium norvegicum]|uniref:Glutathione-regulated potassium-efflux system ancillary protein KefG n=1 Tax=Sinobacterium norvegicum TaxID=1641715 RepID=A0ABM9ACW1_9GAMM|nr:NAD(P)H-dependent oxidoreductase [Sinobacterium norvegicum]CAH0991038.1 Glutathione-regulated potassium-efflux system ancillary protein KefG [Sinobacterium norvegicum]
MADSAQKILILFAHPSQDRSEVNRALFQQCQHQDNITAVDLYGEYPDYHINIEREQQRLVTHDIIIFLYPLYWYSTPAILKEWQDLVLEYGFAYGADGTALEGKTFFCAISAGGPEEAYQQQGFNHFTLNELLQPIEQTARLTGMRYLPPFALFSSRTAVDEGRLPAHIDDWQRLLTALQQGRLNLKLARQQNRLNNPLTTLIEAEL